jgi:hypothetical protein
MAEIEQAVVDWAFAEPACGQLRLSNELKQRGRLIPAAGVGGVWRRHDLETMKKRLKAWKRSARSKGFRQDAHRRPPVCHASTAAARCNCIQQTVSATNVRDEEWIEIPVPELVS